MDNSTLKNFEKLAKPRTPRFRYFYRSICALVLTTMALVMFLFVWLDYVSGNNHTGYLLGYGNISMASFLYVLLFAVNGKFLHAFMIGVERKTKQIASVILTACFTDFIEIFVSIGKVE